MVTRLRASFRHGGAVRFFLKRKRKNFLSTLLIRRGGVPSGAAAFIATGGMGVSTPLLVPEFTVFHRKCCKKLRTECTMRPRALTASSGLAPWSRTGYGTPYERLM
jgi:hypothetical protein